MVWALIVSIIDGLEGDASVILGEVVESVVSGLVGTNVMLVTAVKELAAEVA